MERKRFIATAGNSELDFVISENIVTVHCQNIKTHDEVKVSDQRIFPATLKAFRGIAERHADETGQE